MTWAKVDDTLHSHRKVRRAGLEAMGLWLLGLSHCAAHLTDGEIHEEDVEHLCGSAKLAERLAGKLVAAGFWVRTEAGWRYHDWGDYQPTRSHVLAERARKAEAGRQGGLARARNVAQALGQAPAEAAAKQPASAGAKHPASAGAKHPGNPPPGRSRPIDPASQLGAQAPGSEPDPEPPRTIPELAAQNTAILKVLRGNGPPKDPA